MAIFWDDEPLDLRGTPFLDFRHIVATATPESIKEPSVMTGLPPLFLGRSSPGFRPWNQPQAVQRAAAVPRRNFAHFPAMYSKPLSISVFNWSMACTAKPNAIDTYSHHPRFGVYEFGIYDADDVFDDPTG